MDPEKNLPLSEAFSRDLARYQPVSERHAAILRSWREHPAKDDLWRTLHSAAVKQGKSPPEPADFIGIVLGSAMPARRLNDHSKQVRERFEKLKQEISEIVKDAIYPLDLWRDLQRFETALRELGRSDYDPYRPAGGRKDQNNSRDRKLFALKMSQYLKNSCGQPLPGQVTTMLDIVFPNFSHDERLVREWLAETAKPVV